MSELRIWRLQRFGRHFGVYLTGWFYFTNHSYAGEQRYFVRVGEWRKNFGGIRAALSPEAKEGE
jgi:hypothetical protein